MGMRATLRSPTATLPRLRLGHITGGYLARRTTFASTQIPRFARTSDIRQPLGEKRKRQNKAQILIIHLSNFLLAFLPLSILHPRSFHHSLPQAQRLKPGSSFSPTLEHNPGDESPGWSAGAPE